MASQRPWVRSSSREAPKKNPASAGLKEVPTRVLQGINWKLARVITQISEFTPAHAGNGSYGTTCNRSNFEVHPRSLFRENYHRRPDQPLDEPPLHLWPYLACLPCS
ncbi:hypothetical protein THIARS_70566 [Thiomonas delicata]|uniref:Uncharacterized protein n=1 Tax=Thiomonas delicata TaxID=364030 RepID=A0A238D6K8_THIDL|nr:hypothetical protein THIARS_70566 [Thiomonas delicata]